MSGSLLAMAPAIESTTPGAASAATFTRSHATPNLLLLPSSPLSGDGVPVRGSRTEQQRLSYTETASFSSTSPAASSPTESLPLKSLPSLPAFDVPLFDISLDLETDLDDLFAFRKKNSPSSAAENSSSRSSNNSSSTPTRRIWEEFITQPATQDALTTKRPSTATSPPLSSFVPHSDSNTRPATAAGAMATTTTAAVIASPDGQPLSRRRTLAGRPRSWMPGMRSSSSPDVGALLLSRGGADKDAEMGTAVSGFDDERARHETESDSQNRTRGEQQKTSSALFVDFARRSWRGRSPSPAVASPSTSPSTSRSASPALSSAPPTKGRLRDRMTRRRPMSMTQARERSSLDGDGLQGGDTGNDDKNVSSKPMAATVAAVEGSTPLVTLTDATTSSSRVLSRAGGYIARIKERPQSLFGRPPVGDEGRDRRRRSSSTSSTGNTSSSRNSSEDNDSTRSSIHGSMLLPPPSEAESLTTADTSHHTSPLTKPATAGAAGAAAARDPLWTAFRDLETSFSKFLSKTSTAQRMILVRASLVPFLRWQVSSTLAMSALLPEDVERRAAILNRWWTGLLEMLDGPGGPALFDGPGVGNADTNNSSTGSPYFASSTTTNGHFLPVSGIDRPVVLEAVSMIMSRPEWRLLTPAFRPRFSAKTDELPHSGGGSGPAAAVSTAEHTVRSMFVDNLLAQLLLVVHRLAVRQVPLSMVGFGGKACAYAFFFVPGAAELLVRLWALDQNIALLRRTADTLGLPRRHTFAASKNNHNDRVVALFPPTLAQLGWTSVTAEHARLRQPPPLRLLGERYSAYAQGRQLLQGGTGDAVPWFAPVWLSRWRGTDTDLLFLFCKHYHVLMADFLSPLGEVPTRTLAEKACAPAFVLLHAQLLHIIDSTIHRQAALEAAMVLAGAAPVADHGPSLWMQEQIQQQMQQPSSLPAQPQSTTATVDAKAVNALLYYPHSNVAREMSEHRLLVLLRDLLTDEASMEAYAEGDGGDSTEAMTHARDTFTAAFLGLLKAAALRTSQYDHDACYVLCDLLHETLLVLDGAGAAADAVDWSFWLDVCRKMLASNNTMSEIRVLAFVFGTWDLITVNPVRKAALCVDWLLAEDVFSRFFTHWCPMVRAFYMRLLCWRLCRDTGRAHAPLDNTIFVRVAQRLRTTWSHALWLQQQAVAAGSLPPTTVPSLPQPGRRFMIVRTEVAMPQPGLLARANGVGGSSGGIGDDSRLPVFDSMASAAGGGKKKDRKSADSPSNKKKWSLLGKVRNLAVKTPTDEEFEQLRHAPAQPRGAVTAASSDSPHLLALPPLTTTSLPSPALALSLSAGSSASSTSPTSSTGSSPVFEAAQFVFRFVLHNVPMPPQHRQHQPLAALRPRLPAPAQARVHAWTLAAGQRPDSPPPPAAGMPAITRSVSGLAAGGLVSGARNANSENSNNSSRSSSLDGMDIPAAEGLPAGVQPLEPCGAVACQQAKYAGRALAEWRLVVSECNSFVERRREEGVYGLKDVEVPSLGVDGLRRVG